MYDLWRDMEKDLWILKDKQGNTIKVSKSLDVIKNFIKMKKKIKELK